MSMEDPTINAILNPMKNSVALKLYRNFDIL